MNKEELLRWHEKYNREESQYNTGLETELGNKLRKTKELTREELVKVVEWKFQDRSLPRRKRIMNLILTVDDNFIRKRTNEALCEIEDGLRIRSLMGRFGGIHGVGLALASVILTFYDPKNYGIFDRHIYDEVFNTTPKTRPKNIFQNPELYIKVLKKFREIANNYDLDVRVVEKGLFKKNLDESKK